MFFQTRKPSHGGRGGSIFSGRKHCFVKDQQNSPRLQLFLMLRRLPATSADGGELQQKVFYLTLKRRESYTVTWTHVS